MFMNARKTMKMSQLLVSCLIIVPQYYYNSATGQYLYWNAETKQYVPVAADG